VTRAAIWHAGAPQHGLRRAAARPGALSARHAGCTGDRTEVEMLFASLVFLIAAAVAAILGYLGIASAAAETGLVLFVIFAVLAALLAGLGAIAVRMQERRQRMI
jgi:uncharacterized membrane protein YtjA (UPF0391 family)